MQRSLSPSAQSDGRRLLLHLAILFGLTYAIQFGIYLTGGPDGPGMPVLAPMAMFLPGVFAVAYLLITGEGLRFIDWRMGRFRYWLLAAILPAVTAVIGVQIITALGWGTSPHFHLEQGQVSVLKGGFVLGKGTQSPWFFALNLMLTACVFALINGVVAAGEEIGWRGFWQKKLINRFGLLPGVALLGLIWAHWHTPIILMGYNYPETPVLGALLLWPISGILVSMFLAWLTVSSNSVWPAALAHGSLNAFHGSVLSGMDFSVPRMGPDLLEIAIWAVVAIAAFGLINKKDQRSASVDAPVDAPVDAEN